MLQLKIVQLRWHASQLYMQVGEVACNGMLLQHGGILHVSYFSQCQLPSLSTAVCLNHQLLLQQRAHLIPTACLPSY